MESGVAALASHVFDDRPIWTTLLRQVAIDHHPFPRPLPSPLPLLTNNRAWLSIGCWFVLALGYGHFWRSLDFRADVSHHKCHLLRSTY